MTLDATIAVTGLHATDNPGPGVAVIRSIREHQDFQGSIVGLTYEHLDPGIYMPGIVDAAYLMPYPSEGSDVLLERLQHVMAQTPFQVVIPTLDSEIPLYVKLEQELAAMGVRTFLPTEEGLELRSKAKLHDLEERGVRVPKGWVVGSLTRLHKIADELTFPVFVKGQYYEAYAAYSMADLTFYTEKIRAKWGFPIVLQEMIVGEEYDVAALGDGEGGLVGAVPMRKMQLTDKGKAWGGITVGDPALLDFSREVIRAIGWRGPMELEIMKARDTGELYLLEINPRFPAWIYLSTGAGSNLCYATAAMAMGREVPRDMPYTVGTLFVRYSQDLVCDFRDYQTITMQGELVRTNGGVR